MCRSLAQYGRVQRDQDERATKSIPEGAPPATPHPADGRITFVRMLSPFERMSREVGRKSASALG